MQAVDAIFHDRVKLVRQPRSIEAKRILRLASSALELIRDSLTRGVEHALTGAAPEATSVEDGGSMAHDDGLLQLLLRGIRRFGWLRRDFHARR